MKPLLILAGALVLAAPLAAQDSAATSPRSSTAGLLLGVGLNGSAIDSDDLSEDSESGPGADFRLGWGFTPQFALVAGLTGAVLESEDGESVGLGHLELGARYSFADPRQVWIPYVEGAAGIRVLAQDDYEMTDELGNVERDELALVGPGYSLAGGLQYFVAPAWALGAELRWTGGEFTTVEFGDVRIEDLEIDATSMRLTLGVTWYPLSRRAAR